mgnify:CR=1 FL=1
MPGKARGAAALTSGSGSPSRRLDRRLRGRRGIGCQQRQGARPRDRRLAAIEDQPIELLLGVGGSDPPGMECGAVMRGGLPPAGIPAGDGLGGPLGGPIGVALGAGVRGTERHRQVGTRNPDAVIAPRVDDHVILRRHMAVDALRAGAAGQVVMVRRHVELFRQVALRAERIALGSQLRAVRVVAVRAGDPGGMHAALQERAVFVDLAVDLPVGVIETGFEQRRQVGVEEGRARRRALGDHFAARVTGRTGLELGRRQLLGAPGDAGLRVHLPMAGVGRLQPIRQAHPCSVRARRIGAPAACALAQATCREPGPWQASQATSRSVQLVA